MAMTYSNLIGPKTNGESIAAYIGWAPISDVAPAILTDAQNWIYSQMRVREMRASAPISIAINDVSAALPTGFLDPMGLRDQDGNPIRLTDDDRLEDFMAWDGTGVLQQGRIARYAIFDELLNFNCKSDIAQTLRFRFFKQPTALAVSTNETNFLTNRYSHLLREVCVAFGHKYREDLEHMQSHLQLAATFIQSVNISDDFSRRDADYPLEDR